MAINLGFIALNVFAGVVLLLVLFLISRARPWHYPVRYVDFDFGVREKAVELASRGPSGGEPEDDEGEAPDHERAESEEPQSFWDRVKMGLYTYPKRPSKP